MDDADVLDQRVADRRVIDQPFHRFADFGLRQDRILLVEAEVIDGPLRRRRRLDVLVRGDRGKILRCQVARDVDVALLEQQALRGRFLDVPIDHARQFRFFAVIVVVALERENLVGAPFAYLERAGAGVVGLEPSVAQVVVLLFRQHELLVDDRGDVRRQAVQEKRGRVRLVRLELKREGARLLDLVLHVVLGESELREDERRGLVEDHRALKRKRDVLGRERIARGKFQPVFQFEVVGLSVRRNGPRFGDVGKQLGRIADIEAKQAIVAIAHDLAGRDLERFRGVHRDDVVDRPGDDQRVLRRGRIRRRDADVKRGDRGGAEQPASKRQWRVLHGISLRMGKITDRRDFSGSYVLSSRRQKSSLSLFFSSIAPAGSRASTPRSTTADQVNAKPVARRATYCRP